MKLFLKALILLVFSINLHAQVFSTYLENDVIDGDDKHYTSGTAFTYLSDKDTNNSEKYNNKFYKLVSKIPTFHDDLKYQTLGITYSHLVFTPSNLHEKNKIVGDLPYAGVATLDFMIFKWDERLFHQYMLTLGLVGPSTKTSQLQEGFHDFLGGTAPQGWNNQLEDDFLYNFSYSFGYKAYRNKIGYNKVDLVNSFKIDVGNYTRAVQLGSVLRYGYNYPNNFNTVGRFIGGNEHKLLNLDSKTNKNFSWSISYGLAYSYIDYFYVNDYDKSFQNEKIENVLTQVVSLDGYFNSYVLSFVYKSSDLAFDNNNNQKNTWAGVNIAYLF